MPIPSEIQALIDQLNQELDMTQSSLTQEQEAKLAEALEIAKLFEERAKELSDQGDAFAEKWKKRLREANASR